MITFTVEESIITLERPGHPPRTIDTTDHATAEAAPAVMARELERLDNDAEFRGRVWAATVPLHPRMAVTWQQVLDCLAAEDHPAILQCWECHRFFDASEMSEPVEHDTVGPVYYCSMCQDGMVPPVPLGTDLVDAEQGLPSTAFCPSEDCGRRLDGGNRLHKPGCPHSAGRRVLTRLLETFRGALLDVTRFQLWLLGALTARSSSDEPLSPLWVTVEHGLPRALGYQPAGLAVRL